MVDISKPKPSDFFSIYLLLKELYPKERFSKNKLQKIFLKQLKNKNQMTLVAKEHNEIIGFANLNLRINLQEQGIVGLLTELIVTKEHRKKGIGTKLLKAITNESKKKKCKEIQFSSTLKRKKAHLFYKKLGYKKTAYFFWKKI